MAGIQLNALAIPPGTVTMSDGFLQESFHGVDWGVATADAIAAQPPHAPDPTTIASYEFIIPNNS